MLVEKLHQIMAEEDDPASTPETYHLPEAVHTRFREKVFLYREANILLAPDHAAALTTSLDSSRHADLDSFPAPSRAAPALTRSWAAWPQPCAGRA